MESYISKDAVLAPECTVGPFSVVHPGVRLGKGTHVGSFCELGSPSGEPLDIGEQSLIRSYASVQGGSTFGRRLQIGQYTMIRGGMRVGINFQIGSNCELQGLMQVGDYVRVQSGVHLGKRTSIGEFTWIFPNVLTVNDPMPPSDVHEPQILGPLSIISANSMLMPGVEVGIGAFIAANSVVRRDVAPGSCVFGDPATEFTTVDRLFSLKHRIRHPWPRHFTGTLDAEGRERAIHLMEKVLDLLQNGRSDVGR